MNCKLLVKAYFIFLVAWTLVYICIFLDHVLFTNLPYEMILCKLQCEDGNYSLYPLFCSKRLGVEVVIYKYFK